MPQLQEASVVLHLAILASGVFIVSSTYNNSGKPVRIVLQV